MNVILATHSSSKIAAAVEAFKRYGVEPVIVALNAPSGVSDRPIDDTTITGCRNRLVAARRFAIERRVEYDFIISIESGYFKDDLVGPHMKTAVLIQDSLSTEQLTWSLTTPISQAMYDWAVAGKSLRQLCSDRPTRDIPVIDVTYCDVKSGCQTDTGLERVDLGLNHSLTKGALNRLQLTTEAIAAALAPFLMAENYRRIDEKAQ